MVEKMRDYNLKMIDIAQANTVRVFEFARQLATANSSSFMLALDKVVAWARIRGLAGPAIVEVVRVGWIGSDALNVVYRGNDGPAQVLLYREAEPRLELVQASRAFSFDGVLPSNAALVTSGPAKLVCLSIQHRVQRLQKMDKTSDERRSRSLYELFQIGKTRIKLKAILSNLFNSRRKHQSNQQRASNGG